MRHRLLSLVALLASASLPTAATLAAQQDSAKSQTWRVEGLRKAFCIEMLLAPTSHALEDLPTGYRAIPASEAAGLHVALRSVVESQPEYAAWSPSSLCFLTADTVHTSEYTVGDRRRRHQLLFATWTVQASGGSGSVGDVALDVFSNNDRLIRSARLADHILHDATVQVGLVPAEDDEGVPSTDQRFLVKLGKSTIIWDGRPARDSSAVRTQPQRAWAAAGARRGIVTGQVALAATHERPMVGALKVEGKGDLAKALKASPTRFAGHAYEGGRASISFAR
jgi:hypothetical protein